MHIRPLLHADLPRVLDILGTCFSDDALFHWLYPHQGKYPNDLRRFQLIRLRVRLVQQGGQAYVAETEPGCACSGCDGEEGKRIVGFGFFIRVGDDEAGRRWRADSWGRKVERYLLGWDEWYEMKFLQRASDPAALRSFAMANGFNFSEVLDGYWFLGLLGVDPKCQRRGIGERIVQRGLDVAEQENLPVMLKASPVGRGLYQKMRFKSVQTGGVVDEVAARAGLPMLWEPPEMIGTWLEPDGTLKLK
jgi:ribosomal protein S18 acetylase RimI-like enzyme